MRDACNRDIIIILTIGSVIEKCQLSTPPSLKKSCGRILGKDMIKKSSMISVLNFDMNCKGSW